jgi:site-specific recombinase XerD
MKNKARSIVQRTARRKERQVEEWQRIQEMRRELVARLAPVYQTASRARKQLLLDEVMKKTGYARKSAIRLLNDPLENAHVIRRPRLPSYGVGVQRALMLAWKAAHFVCAKRLVPSLPALVEGLERRHHLRLTEEERRQVQTISVATAERFLRTQPRPRLSGFSLTTPGVLRKSQIPVRTFAEWEDERPGFVEMDLVAHCGTHADGGFLHTLTLTDIATGWTECLPLLHKSADAVVAALEQARVLFPFPLLGIDTDDGCEFINERLLSYCAREHLTFTRGRPGVKNDQNHVEQKNGAVVRVAVGYVRLEGVQAYHQLREVYRALRLVVNCFQPSFKLQARVPRGDRMRRIYDVARTPLDRLLASGVLPDDRRQELSERVQQIDPLVLSEHLDALRHALLCHAHLPAGMTAARPRLDFTLTICISGPLPPKQEREPEPCESQESLPKSHEILNWPRTTRDPLAAVWEEILALILAHPEWNSTQILQELGRRDPERELAVCPGTMIQGVARIHQQIRACWEEPWPTEVVQARVSEQHDPPFPRDRDTMSPVGQPSASVAPIPDRDAHPDPGAAALNPSNCTLETTIGDQSASPFLTPANRERQIHPLPVVPLEQAITTYLRDVCELGCEVKTVEWHQLSLSAFQHYLWHQFRLTEVRQLSRTMLQRWLADLHTTPSAWTGEKLSVNTMAAYARSARAFCNWLVQQEYLPETPFPKDSMPKAQRCLPHPIDQETFGRLLQACQLPDGHAGQDSRMTERNHAILWLLLDAGLSASEVCGLRLGDVESMKGTVTVRGKGGHTRTLPLSEKGQQAVGVYLEHARFTPAWQPAISEAQDALLLTEVRQPLTTNSLTLLFVRLSQRAGLAPRPVRPAMLRDTYAIRFLQAGGELHVLQEQLGLADPASVRRYQRFCEEQKRAEAGAQTGPEGQTKLPRPARGSKSQRRKMRNLECFK